MEAKQKAFLCAHYALDKKAFNLTILDIRELSSLADFLVIASGNSDRQVQAIAEAVRLGCKNNERISPLGVEGVKEGRWALLDYGDVMVHLFQPTLREFYDLESMWSEAPRVELPEEFSERKIRLK
ncbi:MAG: ribosome silencing factor [Deltaproteobacteria bacterium]|nr:ribosome silencing factor [Deltaproteobacteria bacterium]